MPPQETSILIILFAKSNLSKVQDKDFKIAIMNMFKGHKEDMNKPLCEYCENPNSGME